MAHDNLDFLRGSFTPLVVPFRNGEVDYEDYARLCEWQIENGANGLLTNATIGEPTTLTTEERCRLASVAVEVSDGRVPVCVGTASESHAQTVEMIR
ncbi:dihydrodipicolinate synthase family protein [Hoeflea sp. WL0058]|uniref:Dihydrodipicolinate synthase family protein n=1 Tax=Flavimaribacter sediminis TaxID=2865987 RepID=A0AAE2ZSW0_9HYPH|nr:dihydrodipicolinate synthase family protein [Flavimaribacter sediminis]